MREAELLRQRIRYQKQQQAYFNKKQEAMMKSITAIQCRMLRHCRLTDSKYCVACSQNKTRDIRYPNVNYFKPKVEGITVLP